MKKTQPRVALILGLALAAASAAWAFVDGSTFLDTTNANPSDGLIGMHVYGNAPNNRGYSLDYSTSGSPGWSLGLEGTYGDCYLFNYSTPGAGTTDRYALRVRGDTGQMELGQNVPHPTTQQQLNVTAGTSSTPLTGIGVGTYGSAAGLYLHQISGNPTTLRTQIAMNGVYNIGTDSGNNNTPDLWLYNAATNHFVLTANSDDSITVKYGLAHTGSALGFYGAPTVSKQTITGCRSDGTALASLITALKNLGLVNDNTTP